LRAALDPEGGADRAHGGSLRLHHEGLIRVLGDMKERPPPVEVDPPFRLCIFHSQARPGGNLQNTPIGQDHFPTLAALCLNDLPPNSRNLHDGSHSNQQRGRDGQQPAAKPPPSAL
jgi:hypothetical protein